MKHLPHIKKHCQVPVTDQSNIVGFITKTKNLPYRKMVQEHMACDDGLDSDRAYGPKTGYNGYGGGDD